MLLKGMMVMLLCGVMLLYGIMFVLLRDMMVILVVGIMLEATSLAGFCLCC